MNRPAAAWLFWSGIAKPTGYVLPLAFNSGMGRWVSSRWPTRRERIVLVPGDSPVGYACR